MNKRQKGINKMTKDKIKENINKEFGHDKGYVSINLYNILSSNFNSYKSFSNVYKSIKYEYMLSKSYFRKIRKEVRKNEK